MSQVAYDPEIIQEHAANLYSRAARVVFFWTILVGAVASVVAVFALSKSPAGDPTRMGILVSGVVGMMVGYYIGSGRAFQLRLQAQLALCQAAIERNTRSTAPQSATIKPLDGIRPVDIGDAA